MWHKDRYTVALLIVLIGVLGLLYFNNKTIRNISGFNALFGLIYLIIVSNSQSRIISNKYPRKFKIIGEDDEAQPDFAPAGSLPTDIDYVQTEPFFVFKLSNGTDAYIDKDGVVHPAGPGSRLVNYFRGGNGQHVNGPLKNEPKFKRIINYP
jgi:hypothetical protein